MHCSIKSEVDELEEFTSNLIHTIRSSTILANKITAMDILNSYISNNKKYVPSHIVCIIYRALSQGVIFFDSALQEGVTEPRSSCAISGFVPQIKL